MINNPTYATKATAVRGAKRANITNFRIVMKGKRHELQNLNTPLYNGSLRERSTVGAPVAIVHDLASQGLTRKQVIAQAVALGVNKNTASTQYYFFKRDTAS